ncbi:DUF2018 family protein [Nitrosophilus kaiyonis]|uniref:DUF2018 family protein n=1 Tax=Nitrosophilus kaiyonis TaxID=2930200 RepID=UPI002490D329|nr:DUF2018 family protein [Nitrosophilus kaiyonis]
MFNDVDDFMMGTPSSKFKDIVFNANRNVVENELDRLIEWMAALELILEKECGVDDVEKKVKYFIANEENKDELENKKNSLYIESMGNILSESE